MQLMDTAFDKAHIFLHLQLVWNRVCLLMEPGFVHCCQMCTGFILSVMKMQLAIHAGTPELLLSLSLYLQMMQLLKSFSKGYFYTMFKNPLGPIFLWSLGLDFCAAVNASSVTCTTLLVCSRLPFCSRNCRAIRP